MKTTILVLLLPLAGCSAVVDADGFEQADDFEAFLVNMVPTFENTPILVTLVDDDGAVAARVLLQGLEDNGDGARARVFSATDPRRDYHVLVVADMNDDGDFEVNREPTWFEGNVDGGAATVLGGADAAVMDADPPGITGGDFRYTLEGFNTAHGSQHLELAVFDYDLGRGVGSFSTSFVDDTQPEFTIEIPGIIEQGHSYEVQIFANRGDAVGLRGCGDTLDHCWRFDYTAEGPDLEERFVHAGPFDADLDAFVFVE